MRRNVESLQAHATGKLRQEHPRAITDIELQLTIKSGDAEEADVQRAIDASEAKICPVWAMLKGNVNIQVSFTVER
jgi:putative redox protein